MCTVVRKRVRLAARRPLSHANLPYLQEKRTQELSEMFSSLFDMLDTDKGGTLDVDGELLQALQRIGQNIILNDLR